MRKTFFLMLASAYSLTVFGSPLTLETLRAKIKSRGANWVAGETSVSKLSKQEIKNLLGAQIPEAFAEPFRSAMPRSKEYPASFDWRNQNGTNWVNPVLNQGNCGSCVAFASISAMETQLNITRHTPDSPWAPSPQHLFSCGGGGCKTGWTPDAAAQALQDTGVPDEACFPYQSGATGDDVACTQACSSVSSRTEKLVSSSQPSFFFANPAAVKAALQKGPLVAVMYVYEDFLMYSSGVYKHVTGNMAGGHAVMIMGWNDSDHAWIVKNSWGDKWGEAGFFRIDYDDASGVGNQTWAFEVSESSGFVTLGNIRDYTVLKGAVTLPIQSTFTNTQALEYSLNQNGRVVEGGRANALRELYLDTTKYADGVYTLQAIAHHGTETSMSQPRTVYLLNGAFNGSVKINNLQDGQQVTGETTLDITTSASPVPFTRAILTVTNVKTGQVTYRQTYNPVAHMKMLWRAQLLENGKYELKLEGKVGDVASVVADTIHVTVQH